MFSDVPFFLLRVHTGPWGWFAGSFPLTSVVRSCGPVWILHTCLMLPVPSHTIWTRNTASWFRALITNWTILSPGLYIFSKQSCLVLDFYHFMSAWSLFPPICYLNPGCLLYSTIKMAAYLAQVYLFNPRPWLHLYALSPEVLTAPVPSLT